MKLCGLTGGVGMGKSTAAGFLLQLGVRVVDTDKIARELVQPGQPALAEIQDQFVEKILKPDGSLDRASLAGIVFNDEVARKKLEAILHPRIRERWSLQVEAWRTENYAVGVVTIPLLFETQAEASFDKILCVACSPKSQQERLNTRGWTAEQCQQRIAAQMPIGQKIARAHHVFWSEGAPEILRQQLAAVLPRL